MTKKLPSLSFLIISLFFLLHSKQAFSQAYEMPVIKAGTATITGTITNRSNPGKHNVDVEFIVPHPIAGEHKKYKTTADQAGRFSLTVDVETSISLVSIATSINDERYLLIKLTSGGVTQVDLVYNTREDVESISTVPAMDQNDMIRAFEIRDEMITYRSDKPLEPWYERSPDAFLNHASLMLAERTAVVNNSPFLSKQLKALLVKDYRLIMYFSQVFDYKSSMMLYYRNLGDESREPDIKKVDRSYFGFLKDFNLNDPQYLNCFEFLQFQKALLQNEVLGIPGIGETDIPSWLANVKGILADQVGFKDGQYYDILAANAYARQLNEEVKPLTEKQKQHIRDYWKDGEIAKILFRKNEGIVALDKFKSPVAVHDVASVAPGKLMETILARYTGKVVLVDLWATWCVPCLEAMTAFRTAKGEFKGKDVVFVYLTNASSPQKLWQEKIEGIGSEHYYLNDAQWEHVMDSFNFEGIPSYLLYNKKGALVNKFTAFPGSNEVKGMIEKEL